MEVVARVWRRFDYRGSNARERKNIRFAHYISCRPRGEGSGNFTGKSIKQTKNFLCSINGTLKFKKNRKVFLFASSPAPENISEALNLRQIFSSWIFSLLFLHKHRSQRDFFHMCFPCEIEDEFEIVVANDLMDVSMDRLAGRVSCFIRSQLCYLNISECS